MKRSLFFFPITYLLWINGIAQENKSSDAAKMTGKSNSVAFGADIDLTGATTTHLFGFSFQFARSKNRFGRLTSLPANPIGFTYSVGAEYLFGKKDSYNVKYKAYSFVSAFAGFILNTSLNGNLSLKAGPSASVYGNNTLFGIGFDLCANFYFSKNWGVSPSLILFKQQETKSILLASLKGNFSF